MADATTGKLHMYVPLYDAGSLGSPPTILHGLADAVTGPWDFTSLPNLSIVGENPAALVYTDPTSGELVYTLWVSSTVFAAASPFGPFTSAGHFPGGNPAPIFHQGAFYMTNQVTGSIFTAPTLSSNWSIYANISHASLPDKANFHVEDPFLWVDKRGNWHILNHAYDNSQFEGCVASSVSSHFFSTDGKLWDSSVQPYGHVVSYDDGTEHDYVTLERPNLFFDANGQMTHIHLAADLVTGNEGCANRTRHAHNGHTPCDNW